MTWFEESLHVARHGYAQRIEVIRELHRETTPFQEMAILESKGLGRVLVLDGVVQTTERDEFVYHEMISHVPMLAHGNAKRVLIIGGGDGGVLREVLHHPVEQAVMVEIDRAVVERCRDLMPALSDGAFDDPRAEVLYEDGIRFVADRTEPFDVIIVDSTDPMGPGEVLFTERFYADCARLVGEHGVVVTQCGVPFFQGSELSASQDRLRPHFSDVSAFVVSVPTYVGGVMTLGWASNAAALRHLSEADLTDRYAAVGLATRYYSPTVHRAAFALPPFVTRLLG
ncbi:MAG: polyamine aminopropyltransferase [Rhodospirillales bacterium]|nr:MAG: polyamine aminopropyltransferase [Rhodospirillales bacterium]